MEEIKIEKMNLDHFNEIKEVLISEFDDFWNENLLKEEIENENSRYIVAKKNNEIVGFAGIKYNFDNCVEIMNIVTKKNQRRNGIGKILIEKIKEIAKEFCVQKICLEVNEQNLPAINLYQKNGFKQVGVRKQYYDGKFDAILMDYNL